jgi:hypothetical protein
MHYRVAGHPLPPPARPSTHLELVHLRHGGHEGDEHGDDVLGHHGQRNDLADDVAQQAGRLKGQGQQLVVLHHVVILKVWQEGRQGSQLVRQFVRQAVRTSGSSYVRQAHGVAHHAVLL